MHPNAWFCLLPAHGRLPTDIPKLFPPPDINEEGRIPPHAWGSLSIIRRRLSRETAVHWPPKRCFDKMSNEGLHSALPRTKIRLGGFRGPSQAIRKIHIVAQRLFLVALQWVKMGWLRPFSVHDSVLPLFLLPSDLLTRHTFWRVKLTSFYFHFPKIWLPGTKQ